MSTSVDVASRPHSGYRHEAFLYTDEEQFLAGCVPFVRAGLAAGEPVLVALVPARLELLRDALGPDAEGVGFVDMAALGGNPARIIPAWRSFLDEAGRHPETGDARPVRGIGEPLWAGRRTPEIPECQLHEALLNMAVDPDTPFWLRCPYDADALPAEVIEAAQLSHPVIVEGDEFRGSTTYEGLQHVHSLLRSPLPERDVPARELAFGADDLRSVRDLLSEVAAGLIDPAREADLRLAVHELARNSIRHGGGSGRFRIWTTADAVICEVADAGTLADPLAGRATPEPMADVGRGLWLANQLTDLLQLRSSDAGTTVRVTTWL